MAIDYNSEPFDLAFSDASRGVGVGIDKGKGKGKGKGKRVNMDGSCNVPPPDTILDLVGGATEQRSLRLLPPTSGIYLNVLNSGFQTMFRDAGYRRLAQPLSVLAMVGQVALYTLALQHLGGPRYFFTIS